MPTIDCLRMQKQSYSYREELASIFKIRLERKVLSKNHMVGNAANSVKKSGGESRGNIHTHYQRYCHGENTQSEG